MLQSFYSLHFHVTCNGLLFIGQGPFRDPHLDEDFRIMPQLGLFLTFKSLNQKHSQWRLKGLAYD